MPVKWPSVTSMAMAMWIRMMDKALLDYVTGARASISSADFADINHDGRWIPMMYTCSPASWVRTPLRSGQRICQVTVTMTLTEEQKAELDRYYTNGAYVEAYVYAHALTNVEGVEGTSHSIPVLAFYGSWTDSPCLTLAPIWSMPPVRNSGFRTWAMSMPAWALSMAMSRIPCTTLAATP